MKQNISRRAFLKLTGLAGGAFFLLSCKLTELLKGASQTGLPQIENAWTLSEGILKLDLAKLPELSDLGSAVRIEGEVLSNPILVVLGEDGEYYAYQNACTHIGRMLDPVAGTMTLSCSSVICKHPSIYDYRGQVLSGLAEKPLTRYPASLDGNRLVIILA
jgi:nitrite reductase/ring-hydroxylating ferredoxin subunit